MSKRLFIAFPVPVNVRQYLESVAAEIAKNNHQLTASWVSEENMHITVHFLGDVDETRELKVKEAIAKQAALFPSFTCELQRIDAFPNLRTPKVLIVSAKDSGQIAQKIHGALGSELAALGFELDRRPWHPHITLARIKFCVLRDIEKIFLEPMSWKIDSIQLYSSTLGPNGSIYTEEGEWKLALQP